MSLPNGFKNSYDYFYQANEFLKQYSWIYKEANTELLKAGILNKMPPEFQNYFVKIETKQLNKFPYVHEPLENLFEETLINFREKLVELIPIEAFKDPKNNENLIKLENLKKINIKKQHEIQSLAAVVKENLESKGNIKGGDERQHAKFVLIDFGCGLGYLSEILYKLNKNVLILGLEADEYRVKAAEKRIKTFMPTATKSIQYREHIITENSQDFIMKTIKEVFELNYQNTKMFIIGLHACADLTITAMKLFFQLPHIQQLIIMPCCYHKLQVYDKTCKVNLKFKNFPISESFKQVLLNNKENKHNDTFNYFKTNETSFTTYLNRPFLRLACQQTLKRWSKCSGLQHQAHGNEMFLRAVAELFKQKEEHDDEEAEKLVEEEEMELMIVKCKKEKINLTSIPLHQIESFEMFSRFYVLKKKTTNEIVEWSEKHKRKFYKIIENYPNGSKLAEGLTCLQTSMQKLCENLVLYDRLCFMEETAVKMNLKINAHYEKIMDEELSPRSYVLIAEKL